MSSPSPAKSRWSRMGGAVRRASSVLVATRPNTPSIASDKEADAASVKGVPATPPKPSALSPPESSHVQQSTTPSPIAESPAREAAASQEDSILVGPSPLAHGSTVSAEPEVASPQGYVPPPLLDSNTAGLGPGAFTDEPDELPQSQPIVDPSREPSIYAPEAHSAPVAPPVEEAPAPAPVSVPDPEPESSAPVPIVVLEPVAVAESAEAPEPAPEPETAPETVAAPAPAPAPAVPEPGTPPPAVGAARSYFDDIPNQDEPTEDLNLPSHQQPAVSEGFKQVIEANSLGGDSGPTAETTTTRPEEPREPVPEPVAAAPKYSEPPTPVHTPTAMPAVPVPYPMPTYDMNSGEEIWGSVSHKTPEVSRSVLNGNASTRSRVSSIHMPMEDPFADPIPPRITVSHVGHSEPIPHPHISEQHQEAPSESHSNANGNIIMPLPALHEVVPSRPINDFASIQSVKSTNHGHIETDETLPLLSQPGSPKGASYLQPSSVGAVNVSPRSGVPQHSSWAQGYSTSHGPRLHDLGWLEYPLPDGTVYYVHPTRRVTTDIDLRIDKKLDAITGYLIHHYRERDSAPAGMELWLREADTKGKRGGKPLPPIRCWVDHRKRSVVIDRLHENGSASGKAKPAEDDQLDVEYRYWSFMEAHPAHTSLPHNARAEATDVLTWAWTDRLLPSHRNVPAPFTQEECQELMSLLRSFSDQADTELQSVVQTRIVSRVLLRVAHWRQKHFRPNKALPTDVRSNEIQLPKQRKPFRRALVDFIISCMCLGIPYIFFERAHHRFDEESGIRNAAPMLVVGACTCLIVSFFLHITHFVYRTPSWKAAIVLSASVTFLSLPGLDSVSRITGFVAILFSSFSMASTVIALFRYKADMERPISHVGGEGLMMLSRRSVVMSLPLVFLAYAIIGFVTGVVLYSFRGVSITDPLTTEHHFNDYTRWTVIGVLGGMAGMLTTSLLLLRR